MTFVSYIKGQVAKVVMEHSRRRLQVVVRVREDDGACGSLDESPCVSFAPPNNVHVSDTSLPSGGINRSFFCDRFLAPGCSNNDVFSTICRPVIDATLQGGTSSDSLCFLAYGHTNSGKTHTIAGSAGERGILSLCALYLLHCLGPIDVTMIEVYAEAVYDLLARGQQRTIRRTSRRGQSTSAGVVVENLTVCTVSSAEEWMATSDFGMVQRRTSPMELNARSSRSHAIFTLKHRPSGLNVSLVDLAGSERQSIFSRQLNKESISINKSLSRLSTVIEALGRAKPTSLPSTRSSSTTSVAASKLHHVVQEAKCNSYVNFRDTMLTVLLQRYLSGSSLTTFIACTHPNVFFLSETLSTLRYTARLHRITTEGPQVVSNRSSRQSSLESDMPHQQMSSALLAELLTLKKQMQDNTIEFQKREMMHQQRIAELERCRLTSAESSGQQRHCNATPSPMADCAKCATVTHHRESDRSIVSLNGSVLSTNSFESTMSMRHKDTKRVAGWLLSRCMSSIPQFHVQFDDYFRDLLPSALTCVGYVTCVACLFPRDPVDETRVGLLDTGDFAMGLSMLDAGIPPFVSLHDAQKCTNGHKVWESVEFNVSTSRGMSNDTDVGVFVLAMFEVHQSQMDAMSPSDDDESTNASCLDVDHTSMAVNRCCGGGLTSTESLVPFAVVFAVNASAPLEHHQAVYNHLITLQRHQEEIESDIARFTHDSMVADDEGALSGFVQAGGLCSPKADEKCREPFSNWESPPDQATSSALQVPDNNSDCGSSGSDTHSNDERIQQWEAMRQWHMANSPSDLAPAFIPASPSNHSLLVDDVSVGLIDSHVLPNTSRLNLLDEIMKQVHQGVDERCDAAIEISALSSPPRHYAKSASHSDDDEGEIESFSESFHLDDSAQRPGGAVENRAVMAVETFRIGAGDVSPNLDLSPSTSRPRYEHLTPVRHNVSSLTFQREPSPRRVIENETIVVCVDEEKNNTVDANLRSQRSSVSPDATHSIGANSVSPVNNDDVVEMKSTPTCSLGTTLCSDTPPPLTAAQQSQCPTGAGRARRLPKQASKEHAVEDHIVCRACAMM